MLKGERFSYDKNKRFRGNIFNLFEALNVIYDFSCWLLFWVHHTGKKIWKCFWKLLKLPNQIYNFWKTINILEKVLCKLCYFTVSDFLGHLTMLFCIEPAKLKLSFFLFVAIKYTSSKSWKMAVIDFVFTLS